MALLNKSTLRKTHKWLGLFFSLFVFVAAGSGVLHNIMSATQKPPPKPAPTAALNPELITITPQRAGQELLPGTKLSALTLRDIGGDPWYQLYPVGVSKPVYVNALTASRDDQADERYAAQIATTFLGGAQVKKRAYLESFNDEYISIFRILPVYRFDADDGMGTRVYVSTMTGSVTRATDDAKQREANIFSLFHKFAFIPDKNLRNTVLTVTTSGIALVAFLGVILFLIPGTRKVSRDDATAATID